MMVGLAKNGRQQVRASLRVGMTTRKAKATATAKANTEILRCAQDDDLYSGGRLYSEDNLLGVTTLLVGGVKLRYAEPCSAFASYVCEALPPWTPRSRVDAVTFSSVLSATSI